MIRKSLIAGLAFLGLVAAGTVAGTAPASAGYSCGSWNGYGGHRYWNQPYSYRHWGGHNRYWGGDWNRGYGKKAYRGGGKNRHHAHRNYNKRRYY